MEIVLIYILKTLVLPIASLSLLAVIVVLLYKKYHFSVVWVVIPIGVLQILSMPVVAVNIANSQQKYAAFNVDSSSKLSPQAIVILGGGLNLYAPEYPLQLSVTRHTLARLRYGAYLYRKTALPILLSGGRVFDFQTEAEATVMAELLSEEFNVPVRWREEQSRNTAENAKYSYQLLSASNIKRILLVTDALHMARAVEQFRRTSLEVIPAPTNFIGLSQNRILNYIPVAYALELSTRTIHEILGRLWYRLRY